MVEGVSDIDVAAVVHGDTTGPSELTGAAAVAAPGHDKTRRRGIDTALNGKGVGGLVVVIVGYGDKGAVDAGAAGGGKGEIKGRIAAGGHTSRRDARDTEGAGIGPTQHHGWIPAEGERAIAAVQNGKGAAAAAAVRHRAKVSVIGRTDRSRAAGNGHALALQVDLGAGASTLDGKGVGVFIAIIVGNAHSGRVDPEGGRGEGQGKRRAAIGDHAGARHLANLEGRGAGTTERHQRCAGQSQGVAAQVADGESAHKGIVIKSRGVAKVGVIGAGGGGVPVDNAHIVAQQVDFRRDAVPLHHKGVGVFILVAVGNGDGGVGSAAGHGFKGDVKGGAGVDRHCARRGAHDLEGGCARPADCHQWRPGKLQGGCTQAAQRKGARHHALTAQRKTTKIGVVVGAGGGVAAGNAHIVAL